MELRQALQAEAADLVVDGLRARHPDLAQTLGPGGLAATSSDIARFTELALRGSQRDALGVMSAAMQDGASLIQAAVRLVQPAMVEVGRLWQENRITVAQEHRATAVSQTVLARAYLQGQFAAPVGRTAMFAGVAGNQHAMGLRILSDAFETIGWEAAFLGADVPIADLVRQVDIDRPELLCLSLSLPGHLAVGRETTERLRAELGNRCPTIWVGGHVTLATDRAWQAVQADGWAADALHALEQVGTMTGGDGRLPAFDEAPAAGRGAA